MTTHSRRRSTVTYGPVGGSDAEAVDAVRIMAENKGAGFIPDAMPVDAGRPPTPYSPPSPPHPSQRKAGDRYTPTRTSMSGAVHEGEAPVRGPEGSDGRRPVVRQQAVYDPVTGNEIRGKQSPLPEVDAAGEPVNRWSEDEQRWLGQGEYVTRNDPKYIVGSVRCQRIFDAVSHPTRAGSRCPLWSVAHTTRCRWHQGDLRALEHLKASRYAEFFKNDPEAQARFLQHFNDPDILDLRPELALSRNLLDGLLRQATEAGMTMDKMSPTSRSLIYEMSANVAKLSKVCGDLYDKDTLLITPPQMMWFAEQVVFATYETIMVAITPETQRDEVDCGELRAACIDRLSSSLEASVVPHRRRHPPTSHCYAAGPLRAALEDRGDDGEPWRPEGSGGGVQRGESGPEDRDGREPGGRVGGTDGLDGAPDDGGEGGTEPGTTGPGEAPGLARDGGAGADGRDDRRGGDAATDEPEGTAEGAREEDGRGEGAGDGGSEGTDEEEAGSADEGPADGAGREEESEADRGGGAGEGAGRDGDGLPPTVPGYE